MYTPNLTCFEFLALPGWACALQFNKHSYGSRLYVFLYLHSTLVVHLPENAILSLLTHCLIAIPRFVVIAFIVIYTFHGHFSSINIFTVHTYDGSYIYILLFVYIFQSQNRIYNLHQIHILRSFSQNFTQLNIRRHITFNIDAKHQSSLN